MLVCLMFYRAKLADLGLASFVRGKVVWEGDHLRLVRTATVLQRNKLVRYHPFYVKLVVDVSWLSLKEWYIRLGS